MTALLRLCPIGLALLVPLTSSAQDSAAPVVLDPFLTTETALAAASTTVSRLDLSAAPQAESTLPQLASRAANFFAASNDAHSFNDTFALRGLTNTPIFGDPSVGFYLDDLPLGSAFTFPDSLTGFATAELHRGPGQATRFGRAGSAGTLTLLTPASAAMPVGELRVSTGNFSARSASASFATAAAPHADVYVAAAYSARDGYVTNTTLHRTIDDRESTSDLARVRVRPAPAAEVTLLVTALRARDGAQPLVPLGGPLFSVTRKNEGEMDLDAYNASLTASFITPIGKLSATTSLNDWDLGPYNSVLAFGPSELNNLVTQHQKNWNEELKLGSDPHAALRWHAGAFFSDGRTDGAFTRLFGPFVYEQSTFRVDTRSRALFGETTTRLSDVLDLTAGLRIEDSVKTLLRDEAAPTSQTFDLRRASSALLPKLTLNATLATDTKLFAALGAGYKPGGFSAFTGNRALAGFGPERTATAELGVTRTSTDHRWSATARGFYYAITGYQIERSFATSSLADDYLVVNAPRARSLGGELELRWHPVAPLSLALDLGATDVTLREFRDPFTGKSYAGNQAPYVPAYDISLRADYASERGWFAGADLSSNGRTYYTEAEDLTFAQKSYALLGAHAGFTFRRCTLTFYGHNLADKAYYSAITPGTGHATPGTPRTYGVELRARF